jgi:hypothetical protein
MHGLPPLMRATPGITEPNFSRDPLATEGEATPGPDTENPYENAQEYRERLELEQQKRAMQDDAVIDTVPNPQDPDLPPALLNDDPTSGDDPYLFDDVEKEVDNLGLPGMGKQPDLGIRFETGGMFEF